MKKIGIITELTTATRNNVNYGNKLQAYALNHYLNMNYTNFSTYTLILSTKKKLKATKYSILYFIYTKLIKLKRMIKKEKTNNKLEKRSSLIYSFVKNNIKLLYENIRYKDLIKLDFDLYIVGSDVVWSQSNYSINRIKFLDLKTLKKIYKISYAASFGRDYIPEQNIKYVKKYLSDFNLISVREKSSIDMLKKININNVKHVCDPTLLLNKNEWSTLENNPNLTSDKYIFVYLLGKSSENRKYITNIARQNKLKIITIPNADGNYNKIDDDFGDYRFNECTPENWLWLIHNAEYVFTDSFHGLVFSTIFRKKFIILKRETKRDINNRINDFLSTIKQRDKLLNLEGNDIIGNLNWDYDVINNYLVPFIDKSKKYLQTALIEGDNNE